MKEFLFHQFQKYKSLSIHSPMTEERVFNPKTEKSSVKQLTYYQFCLGIETEKMSADRKTCEKDAEITGRKFDHWNFSKQYADYMVRAKRHAGILVKEELKNLSVIIIQTVRSYYNSMKSMGKIKPKIQQAINSIKYKNDTMEWSEEVLFILGVITLKSKGQYSLLEDKGGGFLALQKKAETSVEDEQEDEGEDIDE